MPLLVALLGSACVSTERAPKPVETATDDAPGCAAWDGTRGRLETPAGASSTTDTANLERVAFTDGNQDILNPERGFHTDVDLMADGDLGGARGQGYSLVRSYIRLDAYRESAIDSPFLDRLDRSFERLRVAGLKVVLRFAYNFGIGEPDASESRVLGHIGQLAPLLRKNADVIAVRPGGLRRCMGGVAPLDERARCAVGAEKHSARASRRVAERAHGPAALSEG